MSKKIGVIDIGSNTVLLTAGTLHNDQLQVLLELHDVARLSEGLQDGGPLNLDAKNRVLETLADFQKQAHALEITELVAAGTAAFRRAGDGTQFAQEIRDILGIPTVILSGEEEAAYSFASAVQDFQKTASQIGVIDIGGGSTELVLGNPQNAFSLPIGTVRLAEIFAKAHPISDSDWDLLRQSIREALSSASELGHKNVSNSETTSNRRHKNENWIAVAATPPALASVFLELENFAAEKVHGYQLHFKALQDLNEKLRRLNIEERCQLRGMDPKRAELLPIGGLILEEAMNFLGIEKITVSHRGLRYGLLMEKLRE